MAPISPGEGVHVGGGGTLSFIKGIGPAADSPAISHTQSTLQPLIKVSTCKEEEKRGREGVKRGRGKKENKTIRN